MAAAHKETVFSAEGRIKRFQTAIKRRKKAIKVSSLDERQLKFSLWAVLILIRFSPNLRRASLG